MIETSTKTPPLELNVVKMWTKRIKDAKEFFKKDFERMGDNMKFAAGLQREGQDTINSKEYVANFVNREVNQKVANLYAKNPKAVFKRRKRLDYQIWDGSIETMQMAHQIVAQGNQNPQMQSQPEFVTAQALLNDVSNGKKWEALVERVGRTIEIVYSYECDTQSPTFKYQMKQLVRRVVTTGVGYVRMNFARVGESPLKEADDSLSMRIKRARAIMADIKDDDVLDNDPRREQLEQLFHSVSDAAATGELQNVAESISFDFPSATSIIVDPRCRSLKGFIGARWQAQQYILPIEDVNAYFETDIKVGGDLVTYAEDGTAKMFTLKSKSDGDVDEKPLCCLYEVFDIITKSVFFIVDGWKQYVQEPQSVTPSLTRFWPTFAVTFNDIECEPGGKLHIYPPSDVELIRHPQMELNRQREELVKHRKANRPWYGVSEGILAESDSDQIANHESSQLVGLKGVPPGTPINQVIQRFDAAPLDTALYESSTVMSDASMVIGSNGSYDQQPIKNVAATPAVIQEQSRMQSVNSNVDDMDDLLSEMAYAGSEIIIQEFSLETVKRIAGQGAVIPEDNRQDFLNEIYLESVAASSGRPNKAIDVANAQQLVPLMMQAGANPWAVITKILVPTLDANMEPSDFAPTMPPQLAPPPAKGGAPMPSAQPHVGQAPGGMGKPVGVQ